MNIYKGLARIMPKRNIIEMSVRQHMFYEFTAEVFQKSKSRLVICPAPQQLRKGSLIHVDPMIKPCNRLTLIFLCLWVFICWYATFIKYLFFCSSIQGIGKLGILKIAHYFVIGACMIYLLTEWSNDVITYFDIL